MVIRTGERTAYSHCCTQNPVCEPASRPAVPKHCEPIVGSFLSQKPASLKQTHHAQLQWQCIVLFAARAKNRAACAAPPTELPQLQTTGSIVGKTLTPLTDVPKKILASVYDTCSLKSNNGANHYSLVHRTAGGRRQKLRKNSSPLSLPTEPITHLCTKLLGGRGGDKSSVKQHTPVTGTSNPYTHLCTKQLSRHPSTDKNNSSSCTQHHTNPTDQRTPSQHPSHKHTERGPLCVRHDPNQAWYALQPHSLSPP